MSRDADGNGKVTAGELPRSMVRVMELSDENKDGSLDDAEAKRFAENMGRFAPGSEGTTSARRTKRAAPRDSFSLNLLAAEPLLPAVRARGRRSGFAGIDRRGRL